jgi:hypothetical protein
MIEFTIGADDNLQMQIPAIKVEQTVNSCSVMT